MQIDFLSDDKLINICVCLQVGALALFTAAGSVFTVLIPESRGKSLEELAGE